MVPLIAESSQKKTLRIERAFFVGHFGPCSLCANMNVSAHMWTESRTGTAGGWGRDWSRHQRVFSC